MLYVIFTEGSTATTGDRLLRPDLAYEANRLARMLAALDEFKALLVTNVPSVTLPGAASPAVAIPRKTAA